MFPESCEVEEPYYLVKETGSVEMVFTLPTDSTFKNISRYYRTNRIWRRRGLKKGTAQ